MFLKSKGVSDLTPVVPSVKHFFSGVVIHHGVVAVLVCELYVGVPLSSCLGVVSKVDGSGPVVNVIDTVDHSAGDKSIAHQAHLFCTKSKKRNALIQSNVVISFVRSNYETLFITQITCQPVL